MPQASLETMKAWPHGQDKALQLLRTNFKDVSGTFTERHADYKMTSEEEAAIQYMIEEWDYAYQPGMSIPLLENYAVGNGIIIERYSTHEKTDEEWDLICELVDQGYTYIKNMGVGRNAIDWHVR